MTRDLFTVPQGASEPAWFMFEEENGLVKFKVQIEPRRLTNKTINNMIMRVGRRFYRLARFERISGPPDDPPRQPYHVWARLIDTLPIAL